MILKVPRGSNELRSFFDVEKESFKVVLIGKDGGSKFQSSGITTAEVFYKKIDSMPMRQQEMK